ERIAQGWASDWSKPYRADFMSYLCMVGGRSSDFPLRSAISWWAQTEPQSAVEYASSLDESDGRDQRLREALSLWLETDPNNAMAWCNAQATRRDDGSTLASQVIGELDELDPEAAAWILDAQPSLAAEADLRATVLSRWMQWDARAAFEWIV